MLPPGFTAGMYSDAVGKTSFTLNIDPPGFVENRPCRAVVVICACTCGGLAVQKKAQRTFWMPLILS